MTIKYFTTQLNISILLTILISCTSEKNPYEESDGSIPFEVFTKFERFEKASPLIAVPPPDWAAAAHTLVVGDTVHYFWSRKNQDNFWDLRHSYAPVSNPELISHDPRNPILSPPLTGMDSKSIEYPCPFYNPLDKKFYIYYLVKENDPLKATPKQTGLLVSMGDLGEWEKVVNEPVITSEFEHEKIVAGHTAVTIVDETIHIIYTALTSYQHNPTICHATAPLNNPQVVTKNPNNPVFKGSGEKWDAYGVREAEIFKGPVYFHIFYGGRNKDRIFQIGHVRTKDFITFEPNPGNPIFTPSADSTAWDSDGLLTPQVFEAGDYYYLIYAGLNGDGWNKGHCVSGLARMPKNRSN